MRDDIEFNIKFCELVENHPELYDYNRSSYSNRSVQDKAWELIAQELNESATDCKERWKNIRGRYAKVLKAQVLPSGSATTRIKEYYLGPHLRFLNNFMKSRPSKSNIKAPEKLNTFSDDDNNTSGVESNSSLPKPTEGNSASPVTDYMPSTSSTPVIKNPPTLKDVHKSAYEFFSAKKQKLNKKTDSTDSELDLCFLKSVLPDMMAMTPLQKRRFKIGVLNLSFNILAENENITSTRGSESPFSRPYSGSSTYSNSCPPIYTETFQQNSETTAQQNSETTTQQNSETTTQQNSETTTQQNSETTTQQNSETTTQQYSETTSNQDANVVPITTDTSRTTEAQNFYFLPQYSVISSISSQPPQSNDDLDLFQL